MKILDFFKGFNKKIKKNEQNLTTNRFLNIRDIQGNFLYTITTNKVIAYLKIYPKNCNLMNKDEKIGHAKNITKNFAAELKPFKLFFAFSCPM